MSQKDGLKPLEDLIDTLNKHKNKSVQKNASSQPVSGVEIHQDIKPVPRFKISVSALLLILTVAIALFTFSILKPSGARKNDTISRDTPKTASSSSTYRNTQPLTSIRQFTTIPPRIMAPTNVPAHLQVNDDPEEQRERELREQEYDRLQNPDLSPIPDANNNNNNNDNNISN